MYTIYTLEFFNTLKQFAFTSNKLKLQITKINNLKTKFFPRQITSSVIMWANLLDSMLEQVRRAKAIPLAVTSSLSSFMLMLMLKFGFMNILPASNLPDHRFFLLLFHIVLVRVFKFTLSILNAMSHSLYEKAYC